MSAVSRVSIPNSVKKTIQIIKEIAGNHSDEEIYEMLKECSMDPNETAQKLLFQDTFHEVKRKRDKRKESTREATDNNRRPGSQGRVGRTARGIYSLRYTSHDSGDGRNLCAVKENGIALVRDKDITSLHTTLGTNYKAASPEKKSSAYTSRSMDNLPNELIKLEHQSADDPSFSGEPSVEETAVASKESVISFQKKLLVSSIGQPSSSITIASSEGINTPESEPVLFPFLDASIPASVGAIKREANTESVISQDVGDSESPFLNGTGTLEKKNSFVNARVHGNSVEVEGTQFLDAFHSAPSTAIAGTSGSRPSSNYSNRSQHGSGHLKAGPAMEWKPKSTNVNPAPSSEVCYTSGVDLSKGEGREAVTYFLRASDSMVSDFPKKVLNLEGLCISDTQHVIIPDHLQVPESESTGLSFGSFGSNFGLDMRLKVEHEKIEYPEELSESSGGLEENVEQLPSCARDESTVAQENTYSDDQQPEMRENNLSSATDIPSSISPPADYEKSQADVSLVTEGSQRSVIHTAPVYSNFGLMPQMLGSTFPTFEGADLHARDTARLPGFVVPQPFDPSTNYYTSIHRPTSDGDGRLSPFLYPGAAPKYNGSIAVLPPQTGQSPRESANTMILSSTGPTPIVTQTNGVLQTSVAATQQTLPIFRQPAGVHIAHYPPNYNPYNQYFSPFYVPPHAAIHHFVGNAAVFPQQPPTGSLYSHPSATAGTTPVKYPISQYKAAANSGPTGQRAYGMNPAGYSSAISGGNSTGGEDLSSFQFKENYVFITGQQSEGSPIWISPPGRDISTLQTGSFYNVPPHGQSVAFAPTQAGHAATFTGMYHPTQSVAAGSVHHLLQQSQAFDGASEFVGPPAGPQRSSQINWVSNF